MLCHFYQWLQIVWTARMYARRELVFPFESG